MGGRGRKKKKLYHWNYSQYTQWDFLLPIQEHKTGGIGFSQGDFPNPIIEVDAIGRTSWYGFIIEYFPYSSSWSEKVYQKFPSEIIILRREYRTSFAIGWRLPVAPYPQVERIYNGNFVKSHEIYYDRVVDVTRFY